MKTSVWIILIIMLLSVGTALFWGANYKNIYAGPETGQKVDSLNGVYVFYNGNIGNVSGRNTTTDGYNLGLKYQCVEFVKRYYYQHLNHKMPDSWGHARDFYNKSLPDGQLNNRRNLTQFTNASATKPKVHDLLVYDGTLFNKYGHVSIVSKVTDNSIEIIQQNPGPTGTSRETFKIKNSNGKWEIMNAQVMGWLRKE